MASNTLSPEKQQIFEKLQTLSWYSKSDQQVKDKLTNLPEDFNGYLIDLTQRPNEIGSNEIIKLLDIKHGNFNIISIFQARSIKG